MDFAGGTAVHITSGTAVLAFHVFYMLEIKGFRCCRESFLRILMEQLKFPYEIYQRIRGTGPRRDLPPPPPASAVDEHGSGGFEMAEIPPTNHDRGNQETPAPLPMQPSAQRPPELDPDADEPPHNVSYMALGTSFLWIGWFGFNGGSALGGNLRAVSACVSTHVAACSGAITSLFLFWLQCAAVRYFKRQNIKWPSVTHFCDGAVIGLVAITPAAGYASILILNHELA
jgi:Amt family ammonium transporter